MQDKCQYKRVMIDLFC